ncbi:YopX family protein [Cohnella lubricantis]|uniref:YopX protein domain-containing protein n=1 Tax=Cohnella lubricantis TaxID=2163172 RepID=A0A841TDF9_9BACL|nr:YopX family protein [Cohnella lubricantis]MBB6676491.1 hypothetical protein [Cohnella lubricantis]MBP2117108.1 putative phage protein (TIGR01671 family) [Cohnella lubricantis]
MREIKFRGRRVDNGEWIYGSLLDGDIIVSGQVDADGDYIGVGEWSSVDPETVGQLTGLKDRNGKMIYEGDVLEGGLVIEYGRTSCGCCSYVHGYDLAQNDPYYELPEVIGNIYENPSLLGDTGGDGG